MRLGLNRRIAAVAVHDVFMSAVAFELAVWFRYLTYGEPQGFFFLWHGTVLFSAIAIVAASLLVDLVTVALDPRLRR